MVVDASVVVAALLDQGSEGVWARGIMESRPLVAPHLMPAEVGETLRQSVLRGKASADNAGSAHGDLLAMRLDLSSYSLIAHRAWELRGNLSLYDAWYVALAEALGTELATLDRRLAAAPGPRCGFVLPG